MGYARLFDLVTVAVFKFSRIQSNRVEWYNISSHHVLAFFILTYDISARRISCISTHLRNCRDFQRVRVTALIIK